MKKIVIESLGESLGVPLRATLVGAFLLAFTGCSFGSAAPTSAVKNAQVVQNEQDFPPEDVRLQAKTNLFIFWKVENGQVNPNDVAAVVALSEKIQSDEDEQFNDNKTFNQLTATVFAPLGIDPVAVRGEQATLNVAPADLQDATQLRAKLDSQIAPTQAALTALNTANPDDKVADDKITALTKDENTAQAKLDAEQAKPAPDQTVINTLTQQISADDTQLQTLRKTAPAAPQKTWRQYNAVAAPLKAALQGTTDVERVIESDLLASWQSWVAAYDDYQAVIPRCSDDITKIIGGTLSDGTSTPGHVMPVIGAVNPELTIHFNPDGSIYLKLDDWFPPVGWESPDGTDTDNAPIFTTDDGSIRDVSYTRLGGVFQFTVVTRWAEYGFKIARTHYNAADGLKHYQGEINLYSDDAAQTMRGSALLDQTPQ